MRLQRILILLACALMALTISCSISRESLEDKATITDSTGREWDVTYAREAYDMNPEYYNYGLGIGAIPSVDDPVIIEEGDPEYPKSDSRMGVFGVNHNGEQRAYSVVDLTNHEVFNDKYPGESEQYVAVTY